MKAIFCLMCSLVILATITAYHWRGGCQKESECDDEECCIKYNAWYGKCMKRGEEGDVCVPNTDYNKFYKAMCPCREGLECTAGPKGKYPNMEFMKQPLCQKKQDTTTQP